MLKNFYEKYGIKSLLSQNSKMKKSGGEKYDIHNWTLPAFKPDRTIVENLITDLRLEAHRTELLSALPNFTCNRAKLCVVGCYARSGTYNFSNVKAAHHKKLLASLDFQFELALITEISILKKKAEKKNKVLKIRVHDAGDFYSLDYALAWFNVMNKVEGVEFYAYTKEVDMFNSLKENYSHVYPENFQLIYSFGGKDDHMIKETDRHSAVFENVQDLETAGYVNATDSDLLALTENHKVGLVYHGAKSFTNTKWNEVKNV